MKKFKRILALAMAMIMCLGMAVTASAANDGHIVMTNATPNTTYTAYMLFDANPAALNDGETTTTQVAYTTGKKQKEWYEKQPGNPFTFTQVAGTDTYNVTVDAEKKASVPDFLKGLYTEESEGKYVFSEGFLDIVMGSKSDTANADGEVNFDDLPYGYYLITSGLGATVTVSSTNPTATVIDKNVKRPTFPNEGGKVILNADNTTTTKNTVNYGEIVDFKVQITSSNYDGDKLVTKYVIKDTLDAGMAYVNPNKVAVTVTVKIGTTEIKLSEVNENPGQNQYTVNRSPEGLETGKSGFEITIPWADGVVGVDGKIDASTIDTYYAQGATIEVTYSAKVTTNATPGTALTNAATFNYYTNGKDSPENPNEPSKTTETTTYSFDLVKTNEDNMILSGAEFSLYENETGGDAIQLVDDGNGVYHVATSDEIKDGAVVKTPTIVAGYVTIKGLAGSTETKVNEATGEEEVVPKKYWLQETKAPEGYNMVESRKEVPISNANLDATLSNDGMSYH